MPSIHINNNIHTYVVVAVMNTASIARVSCVDFYCSDCHLLLRYMYEPPKKNIRLFIFTYLYLGGGPKGNFSFSWRRGRAGLFSIILQCGLNKQENFSKGAGGLTSLPLGKCMQKYYYYRLLVFVVQKNDRSPRLDVANLIQNQSSQVSIDHKMIHAL